MYSKDRGFTAPPMGVTQRPSRTPRVSVPPNYSGHAIVDGVERPLGMMREEASATDRGEIPTPRFEGLPRISELGGEVRRSPRMLPPAETEPTISMVEEYSPAEARVLPPPTSSEVEGKSSPPSPFRFLSGQGIGLEELLLAGLILFLLRESGDSEDRGDLDETVILLGLLLLLG